jgi:hypothetical protein
MFKVKVKVSVHRGISVKSESFETMVDADTYRNCTSSGSKKVVEAAWCNSMFPGATKITIDQIVKIKD